MYVAILSEFNNETLNYRWEALLACTAINILKLLRMKFIGKHNKILNCYHFHMWYLNCYWLVTRMEYNFKNFITEGIKGNKNKK